MTLDLPVVIVLIPHFQQKYGSSSGGLVGYDASFTRMRSRVQLPARVFLLFYVHAEFIAFVLLQQSTVL